MRKTCFWLCLFIFLGIYDFANAQQIPDSSLLYEEISVETLYPYFKALKTGNVNLIRRCLSEEMYRRYKVLLENNEYYPKFLRNYYRNVDFSIIKAERIDDVIRVSVMIDFPNALHLNSTIVLRKDTDNARLGSTNNRWKILKQH